MVESLFQTLAWLGAFGFCLGFDDFILALDVGFALVELGVDDVDHGGPEHHRGKEPEVVRAVEWGVARFVLGFLHDEVDASDIEVSDRDSQHVDTHDEALHFLGTLGVGELKAHDRDHDFRGSHDDVCEHLPGDVGHVGKVRTDLCSGPSLIFHDLEHVGELGWYWSAGGCVRSEVGPHLGDHRLGVGLDPGFDQCRECEGARGEYEPDPDFAKWSEFPDLVTEWVDHIGEDGDAQKNQHRIDGLDL